MISAINNNAVFCPRSVPPNGNQSSGTGDVFNTARSAVRALVATCLDGEQIQKTINNAVNKMQVGLRALSTTDSLDSAMAQVMREQNRQTDDALNTAATTIKDNFNKLRQQTIEQRRAIEKRKRAQKSKSWWQSLVGFFKKVWDYASAAITACTGGVVGAVAGALIISSLIVGELGKSDAAKWTSFGLGLGGSLLAGFSGRGPGNEGDELANDLLRLASAGTDLAAADCDKDRLNAEADLQEIKAEKKRLWMTIEREKEVIKDFVAAQTRSMGIIVKVLNTNNTVATRATV